MGHNQDDQRKKVRLVLLRPQPYRPRSFPRLTESPKQAKSMVKGALARADIPESGSVERPTRPEDPRHTRSQHYHHHHRRHYPLTLEACLERASIREGIRACR